MRRINLSLIAAYACGAIVWADTYPRQAGVKVTNYTFDFTLNDENNEFVCETRLNCDSSRRASAVLILTCVTSVRKFAIRRLRKDFPTPAQNRRGAEAEWRLLPLVVKA